MASGTLWMSESETGETEQGSLRLTDLPPVRSVTEFSEIVDGQIECTQITTVLYLGYNEPVEMNLPVLA
jgi:hypothetical protein